MAKKTKTEATDQDVYEFIDSFVDSQQKKEDSYRLIELMKNTSGRQPYMWGPSIIGFGNYHYKYASGHEGDAPLIAFSPRKAAISLYTFSGAQEHMHLLDGFGKFKLAKACIYIKKLEDIDEQKLVEMCEQSIEWLKSKYIVQ
jgi:hypothetical protein